MNEIDVSPDLMHLGKTDLERIPEPIRKMNNREAYTKLREWFLTNKNIVDEYKQRGWKQTLVDHTKSLIDALPEPDKISEPELAIVFGELGYGGLEWSRVHETGDGFTVQNYYFGRTGKRLEELSPTELKSIEISPIRPYLFDKRPLV